MSKIIVLDENTAGKIAAGEVIERPSSVVKELLENSIDASADNITVEIKNGGIKLIKVTDNGTGIEEDDVEMAFERHGTSKIRNADDINSIKTMGFRGEALASISAVSNVEMRTRISSRDTGIEIFVSGGNVKEIKQSGCPVGTTVAVKDLFFNTPARYKFLKKDSTEAGHISDIVNKTVLANPGISFRLINNGAVVLHSPGNNDLLSTIFSVYGKEISKQVVEVDYKDEKINITGYVGKPDLSRSNRNHQTFFINNRYIKSKVLFSAVDQAYRTFLMKNKYAFVVLNIKINPQYVDVNVHPSKMEVRFSDEQYVFRALYHAVQNAITGKSLIKTIKFEEKSKADLNEYKKSIENVYPTKSLFEKKIMTKETNHNYDMKIGNIIEPKSESNKINNQDDASILLQKNEKQEESTEKLFDDSSDTVFTDSIKIIGQAFSTYIIIQSKDKLILIDQHAAHERIMFEKLKKSYYSNAPFSQILINPVIVETTHQEIKKIEEEKDFFEKIGFKFENFGNNSIIIREVPALKEVSVKESFFKILDYVMNSERREQDELAEEALYDLACKSAIKGNKKLEEIEIIELIKEMNKLDNPYRCPHGRPAILELSKKEIEKMFKRTL